MCLHLKVPSKDRTLKVYTPEVLLAVLTLQFPRVFAHIGVHLKWQIFPVPFKVYTPPGVVSSKGHLRAWLLAVLGVVKKWFSQE